MKLNKIIEKIKKGKTLIYTNWIDFGIKPIKEVLNSKHIKYRIFSGQSTAKEKEEETETRRATQSSATQTGAECFQA